MHTPPSNHVTPLSDFHWQDLGAEQRQILLFIRAKEDRNLTFESIALNLELEVLPGSPSAPGGRRMISDKKVRKHCEPLFRLGLLRRESPRGSIMLTRLGHDVVDALRAAASG